LIHQNISILCCLETAGVNTEEIHFGLFFLVRVFLFYVFFSRLVGWLREVCIGLEMADQPTQEGHAGKKRKGKPRPDPPEPLDSFGELRGMPTPLECQMSKRIWRNGFVIFNGCPVPDY
jgi:hypothetical protein